MASKFVTLTEAKFPAELKKSREAIRDLHGKLAKAMDGFKPIGQCLRCRASKGTGCAYRQARH